MRWRRLALVAVVWLALTALNGWRPGAAFMQLMVLFLFYLVIEKGLAMNRSGGSGEEVAEDAS